MLHGTERSMGAVMQGRSCALFPAFGRLLNSSGWPRTPGDRAWHDGMAGHFTVFLRTIML
jgi:hypothetical protein